MKTPSQIKQKFLYFHSPIDSLKQERRSEMDARI